MPKYYTNVQSTALKYYKVLATTTVRERAKLAQEFGQRLGKSAVQLQQTGEVLNNLIESRHMWPLLMSSDRLGHLVICWFFNNHHSQPKCTVQCGYLYNRSEVRELR